MYTLYEPHIQPMAVACYCYQIQANQQKRRLCCLYQHQSTVILRRLNKFTVRTTLNFRSDFFSNELLFCIETLLLITSDLKFEYFPTLFVINITMYINFITLCKFWTKNLGKLAKSCAYHAI